MLKFVFMSITCKLSELSLSNMEYGTCSLSNVPYTKGRLLVKQRYEVDGVTFVCQINRILHFNDICFELFICSCMRLYTATKRQLHHFSVVQRKWAVDTSVVQLCLVFTCKQVSMIYILFDNFIKRTYFENRRMW